jgi:hypothetical protein
MYFQILKQNLVDLLNSIKIGSKTYNLDFYFHLGTAIFYKGKALN